jgi:uncharacterized protein YdeI (YjbR/CyaY-like superfamily)
MNPDVDNFLGNAGNWQKEMEQLRDILLGCGLTEEFKWKVPVYTWLGKNVIAINGLKEYCVLAFFKGALLLDTDDLLSKPGDSTQAPRWIKFTSYRDIIRLRNVLKAYIYEAIEVEKAGVKLPARKPLPIPVELEKKFKKNAAFKKAFYALTAGRQRAYLLHFSQPKQSKTRESRIDKFTPLILKGKGINDDYNAGRKNKGTGTLRLAGLFLVSLLAFSCGHRRGPMTAQDKATITDSVVQLTRNIAGDLSANGPAVWLKYFDDAPGFFMIDDGNLSFPDYGSARRFILDTLVKNIPHITLNWSAVRVFPLSRHIASIDAQFHEVLMPANAAGIPFEGYLSATAALTSHGWKLHNLHWSTRKQ